MCSIEQILLCYFFIHTHRGTFTQLHAVFWAGCAGGVCCQWYLATGWTSSTFCQKASKSHLSGPAIVGENTHAGTL